MGTMRRGDGMFTEVVDDLVEAVELAEVATADDFTSVGVAQWASCFHERVHVFSLKFIISIVGTAIVQEDSARSARADREFIAIDPSFGETGRRYSSLDWVA
jgi:hypothetical protein